MALSNKERVGRVLDALSEGLAPYIVREYRQVYKNDFARVIDNSLQSTSYGLPQEAFADTATLISHLDAQNCLKLMISEWFDVFHDKLGHTARSYVGELLSARNTWAHERSGFTIDEAYRVADTASLLLKMVGSPKQSEEVGEIAADLLRKRFEGEAEKSRQTTNGQTVVEKDTTTLPGLKPWRQIVQPHPDVASGRYVQAEFAADLAQVLAGTAPSEYQDAEEFFRRTYLTEGLVELLSTGIQRLTGQGGDPVMQLKTSFGGGKTHSMLALYHLAGSKIPLPKIPGGERIIERIGETDPLEANRAVLVGTSFSATNPTVHEDLSTHTLWGEMAYQLGGIVGYLMVEDADKKGVNPGADVLHQVLDEFGPCLIIIDELVAYARNVYGVEDLPSGSFDAIMSFTQSITEAVKRSQDSMLLISIPQSEIEVGGDAGQEVLEVLTHIVERIESSWRPVTPRESFEIVRRRLFSPDVDYPARDAVVDAYRQMYRNNASEFPSGVSEGEYADRMKAAYPIHPEMFERLYEDWSTLERFQRTRGVLRLMASVIHNLWTQGDQSLLIMPGTMPLNANTVRSELLRYLPQTWDAVFDRDVDGPDSQTLSIDQEVPTLGRYSASRRIARTVFLGSAPSVAGQSVRGLEMVRLNLGCVQPGETINVFGDALRRMSSRLTYLYTDGSRHWYDTRPTVNRVARDRAQAFSIDEVNEEVVKLLKKVPKPRNFSGFHVVPYDTSDVADTDEARIVVLHPEATHKRSSTDTPALEWVTTLLENRGNAQRIYKNMLLFLAADESDMASLHEAVREQMAWQSIQTDYETLNLDAQQRRQVAESLSRAEDTVGSRLMNAYSWLLTPYQGEALDQIEILLNRISGQDNFYERAYKKLLKDDYLIPAWSPDNLWMQLDRYVWGDDKQWEVGLKQMWDWMAQYCYFPRLTGYEVLRQAVQEGVSRLDARFAYATGKDRDGYHTGVAYQSTSSVYFDSESLIIHPDFLSVRPTIEPIIKPEPIGNGDGGEKPGPSPKPAIQKTRYYGRVQLDPQRVNKDIAVIVEEVIERLTSQRECNVEITLEINASMDKGFDEAARRTINENSRTLKFDHFDFEE